jgi:hypothetical protein
MLTCVLLSSDLWSASTAALSGRIPLLYRNLGAFLTSSEGIS